MRRHARSGELNIAYQVIGNGPIDLVHFPGLISHLDAAWTYPKYARFIRRLPSFAARLQKARHRGPHRPARR
jgi:hypothetical protein